MHKKLLMSLLIAGVNAASGHDETRGNRRPLPPKRADSFSGSNEVFVPTVSSGLAKFARQANMLERRLLAAAQKKAERLAYEAEAALAEEDKLFSATLAKPVTTTPEDEARALKHAAELNRKLLAAREKARVAVAQKDAAEAHVRAMFAHYKAAAAKKAAKGPSYVSAAAAAADDDADADDDASTEPARHSSVKAHVEEQSGFSRAILSEDEDSD